MQNKITKAVLVLLLTIFASTLKIDQSTTSASPIYLPGWKTIVQPGYFYVCSCPTLPYPQCMCLFTD